MIGLRPLFSSATRKIARAAERWARRRQGKDGSAVELAARRVYILPSSIGVTFALTTFVMLLGSMNYNNSLAFVLTFALAAIGLITMHHTHGNLANVVLHDGGYEPAFAGEPLRWKVIIENPSASARHDIVVAGAIDHSIVDVDASANTSARISQATERRGPIQQSRFRVRSDFPLGLFRAWGWVNPEREALVWPRPAALANVSLTGTSNEADARQTARGDDDFAGLRDYQPGDPSARIAWQTLARLGELNTKKFEGSGQTERWIDIDALGEPDLEKAVSLATRLVVDMSAAGSAFGLRLGAREFVPASGHAHRNACLDALAVYGLSDASG